MQTNFNTLIEKNNKLIGELLSPIFYYDIFSYPLTEEEIVANSMIDLQEVSRTQIKAILALGVQNKWLYQIKDYYLLASNQDWVLQRIANNKRAKKAIVTAKKMTKLMSWFPYVRAVFISGSLSKNVMPEDGDIDYFVVTQPERLWITRTFLILFKKVFLLNSKKYFCVNYFVAKNSLEIEEKNRFTATEIATVLPLYGQEIYESFWQQNNWISSYYPNSKSRKEQKIVITKKTIPQYIIEFFLDTKLGDWLDAFFMKKTWNHWQNKFPEMEKKDFQLALKSKQNVSKHHPQLFQRKVIAAFEKRVIDFEKTHAIQLLINTKK